jgi:hypothetical protein
LRCLSLLASPLLLAALTGCSYHSAYVPIDDGRARLVWSGTQAVAWTPTTTPECLAHVTELKQVPVSYLMPLEADPGDGGSGGVVVVNGGGRVYGRHSWAPHAHGGGSAGSHVGGAGGRFGGGGHIGGSGGHVSGGGHGGGGHGGGGGGGDWGKAAVALLVLAYVAVPITAIVWATDRPESEGVARGMDEVHAYNDLVRSGDPACGGWQ